MKWPLLIATFLICFFACKTEKNIPVNSSPSIFDWLSAKENIVHLEIKGDLSHLFEDLHEADYYHPASLKLERGDSLLKFDIELTRRGVTRRKICNFPPIKLKLSNDTLATKGFSLFNNYKLVTHCMEGEDELVLKEYLTYKLFNQITPKSFRVKLAKIKYIDESGGVKDSEHFGFLIEDNKELASRLGGKMISPKKIKITRVDKEQYRNMVLFQYMIGNTDWNLSKGHNIKWIQPKSSKVPTPIPYDFDYSGLVNAPYAVPHPQIPIKHVRERFLQWRGKNKEELIPICENFKAQKIAFLDACQEFENLEVAHKKDMISFIESFFQEVEDKVFL